MPSADSMMLTLRVWAMAVVVLPAGTPTLALCTGEHHDAHVVAFGLPHHHEHHGEFHFDTDGDRGSSHAEPASEGLAREGAVPCTDLALSSDMELGLRHEPAAPPAPDAGAGRTGLAGDGGTSLANRPSSRARSPDALLTLLHLEPLTCSSRLRI
jgi:hypothetical protein